MGKAHEISLRERIRLNLISAMEQANLNQVQLAERLGVSKGTVNNWARGNNSPDVDMVPKICDVLGISITDLYSPARFEPQADTPNKKAPQNEPPTPVSESGQQQNILKMAGRDGSYVERRLTDAQMTALKLMLDQLPDADDL